MDITGWLIKRGWLVKGYLELKTTVMKHLASDIRKRLPASTELNYPTDIVIAAGYEIGENVQIQQKVTPGIRHEPNDYPVIEDDVKLSAGASVLGDITVGRGSVVGANATVIEDVPANSTVVVTPAEVI
jgi:serine acetyltransferase